MKKDKVLRSRRRQTDKRSAAGERLRGLMADLPEDEIKMLLAARQRLGLPHKVPKRSSQSSVMAHYAAVFQALGQSAKDTKKGREAFQRRLDRQAIKQARQLEKKTSEEFLQSYAWRKLRYRVLIQCGRKCMCCGRTPVDGVKMHVDHIKPRKTHPELALDIDNLQVLCEECNHGKGNWDQTDWRGA